MPQPLYPQPSKGHFKYFPLEVASKRPKHAAGIGAVTSEWSFFETELVATIARCFFAFSAEGGFNAAHTTLGFIDSITLRLEIISELLETRIPPEDFKHFQDVLIKEIRNRAKERNAVVHSYWYADDQHPEYIITWIDERYMKYSAQDFLDIAKRILETNDKVKNFLEQFTKWDGVGPWQSMHWPEG